LFISIVTHNIPLLSHLKPTYSARREMLQHISKFTNDAIGLEKTLKFSQAVTQIVAGTATPGSSKLRWEEAKGHFALGTCYLSTFKVKGGIECGVGAAGWDGRFDGGKGLKEVACMEVVECLDLGSYDW
jgi:hypothetical protein